MRVELPWFHPALNPNEKSWKKKMGPKKKQRSDAYLIASASPNKPSGETLPITIIFHPPDRRGRDLDNCLSAIKGALDGIADAIGVDDRNFRPITIDFGEVVKGGNIVITIG